MSPNRARLRVRRRRLRSAILTATSAVLLLAGLSAVFAPAASASPGGDRVWAGRVYHGEFGAPSILRVGATYYAYGTNTDAHLLPVMTSTDTVTWRARRAWPVSAGYSTWSGYNDAMRFGPSWSAKHRLGTHRVPTIWAPSVARVGNLYVMAYTVTASTTNPNRHCISIATSTSPLGMFHDRTKRPFVCSSDRNGSIDPQIFQPGDGSVYLLWKNEGIPYHKPTEIWARQLRPGAQRFRPGTHAHRLLTTARPWEGNVIEAPAMIHYGTRYYLFYSGNTFYTARYATGYAICRTPIGPCRRGSAGPLLATGGKVAGPGAATPFVDKHGRLRLAYSAWDIGHVGYPSSAACRGHGGCNQRRMHIATITPGPRGYLRVSARG